MKRRFSCGQKRNTDVIFKYIKYFNVPPASFPILIIKNGGRYLKWLWILPKSYNTDRWRLNNLYKYRVKHVLIDANDTYILRKSFNECTG